MPIQSFPYRTVTKLCLKTSGVCYPGYNVDSEINATFGEGKTSVNTGVFIPGVYRVNPYTVWKEEAVGSDIEVDVVDTTYSTRYDYYCYQKSSHLAITAWSFRNVQLPSTALQLKKQALQKAYARVQRADLALGESIGELAETIEMLRNPLESLRKFLSADNRRNIRKLMQLRTFLKSGRMGKYQGKLAAKAAADTWLQVRYGFQPLVQTIIDLVKMALIAETKGFNPHTIRSAHATVLAENEVVRNPAFESGLTPVYYQCRAVEKDFYKATASVQYRQTLPTSGLGKFGLSLNYLPETAWELTRLSFVVDWLLSIGPWLASYRVKPNVELLGNTVGFKVDRTVAVTATKFRHSPVPTIKRLKVPAIGEYKFTHYSRVVDLDLPTYPLLNAGNILNLFKTIDATALIAQRILRMWR
jgi:hypothetical protein